MSDIKTTEKFAPTMPPKQVSLQMRDWLREEFDRVYESSNAALRLIDALRASPRMFLAGDADDFNLDTIDSKIVNYTAGGAIGIVPIEPDRVTGDITIPVNGIYTLSAYVYGLQTSPTQNQTIRLLGDVNSVKRIIATYDVATPLTDDRALFGSLSRFLNADDVLSLFMNATADLGLFEIQATSFEVSLVTPLDEQIVPAGGLDW